jgi:hypothetical protein
MKILSEMNLQALILGEDPQEFQTLNFNEWVRKQEVYEEFPNFDISEFFRIWKNSPYQFSDLRREPVYLREDVDPLLDSEFLTLGVNFETKIFPGPDIDTTSSIDKRLITWLRLYREELKASPQQALQDHLATFPVDRISDDQLLLSVGLKADINKVILFTDDLRFARAFTYARHIRSPRNRTWVLPIRHFFVRNELLIYKIKGWINFPDWFPVKGSTTKVGRNKLFSRKEWEDNRDRYSRETKGRDPEFPGHYSFIPPKPPTGHHFYDISVVDTGAFEYYFEHIKAVVNPPPQRGLKYTRRNLPELSFYTRARPLIEVEEIRGIQHQIDWINGKDYYPMVPDSRYLYTTSDGLSYENP